MRLIPAPFAPRDIYPRPARARAQAGYRINTEKIIKHRMSIVEQSTDYEQVEEAIGCGQTEELIEQAKDELELIPVMFGAFLFSFSPSLSRARISRAHRVDSCSLSRSVAEAKCWEKSA